MGKYYTGEKILSAVDLDGKKPEIYIIDGNKSAGKTVYFTRYCMKRAKENGEIFGLYVRYSVEVMGAATSTFAETMRLFFPDYTIKEKPMLKGKFAKIYVQNLKTGDTFHIGYTLAINAVDAVKRYSSVFAEIQRLLFDEFQPESGRYCTEEFEKFTACHIAISRGGGNASRYVPVFMLSNHVSLLNPYYYNLGISERLQSDTKILKGKGWVLEFVQNDTAANQLKESRFNTAVSGTKNFTFSTEKVFLYNDTKLIQKKIPSPARYLFTIVLEDKNLGVRLFRDENGNRCYHVSEKIDTSCLERFAPDMVSHDNTTILRGAAKPFLENMRRYIDYGKVYFENEYCKKQIIDILHY